MDTASFRDSAPKPLEALIEEARLQALQQYRTLPAGGLESLSQVAREAAASLGATQAAVSFVDRTRVWFGGGWGFQTQAVARIGSLCDVVVRSGMPLLVPDAMADSRFRDHELICRAPHVRSYAGVPLMDGGGYTLGSVGVYSDARGRFSASILPNLSGLAALVGDFMAEACRSRPIPAEPTARKPVQGWLGIKVLEPKAGEAAAAGLVVVSVKRDSPAAASGVRPADIIYWIGETELSAASDIAAAMAGRDLGSRVAIRLRRAGEWHECEVEVRARSRSRRSR